MYTHCLDRYIPEYALNPSGWPNQMTGDHPDPGTELLLQSTACPCSDRDRIGFCHEAGIDIRGFGMKT